MTQTTPDIHVLLANRIDAEQKMIAGPTRICVTLFALSLLPLIGLLATAFLLETQKQTTWIGAVLVVGAIVLTFSLWQTGGHFSKIASSHRRRVRQLEDLQLYLATVPQEAWPAKQLLQIVLAGRQTSYGDMVADFCQTEDTNQNRE